MKGSRVLATAAAVALSCFGMASPASAGTPATYAARTGVAVPAVGQAGLGGWQLIGWYPTAGACVRAATAYSIATCTPADGGWVLYVYVND